ncbi:septal ring lytic transglycosylase RlpA family protein [Nonomuraea sp. NPDC049419]|uniref:septal ring lytic transglycosylase RlpA family protein n=1 Tax=Nonomuraea sp. NPDC049419 TaxID=3155772 RepID=UPI0034125869
MGNDDSAKPAAALTPPSPGAKTTRSPEPASARTAEKPPASATQPEPTTSAGSTPTHRNSPNHPGTATSAKPTSSRAQAQGPSSTDRPSTDRPSSADRDSSTGDRSSSAEQQPKSRPAKSQPTRPKLRVLSSGTCGASYYGEPQMTASGERFNPHAMTAAHKTLPLGSRVRVTNPRTGESVTVRINDRGPYIGGRCLDLSTAAFAAIGNTSAGVMRVRYEVLAR